MKADAHDRLIVELQHQLHDSRRRERILDSTEGRRVRNVCRASLKREVGTVQNVERLDLERHVPAPVVDEEVLAQSEIQIPIARTGQNTDARVAELARWSAFEALDVDPRVVDAGTRDRAIADAVRPLERAGCL